MQTSVGVPDLKPLTTLRFFSAMMIVCFHALGYFHWPWLTYVPFAFATGVSFFFVLSGFILTHVYTSKGFPGYATFLRARFARLWPVHVLALICLVVAVPFQWVTYFEGPGIFNRWIELIANLTLTQALVPYSAYTYSWNSVSWSISTEFFFYLAFPLLLIDIRRTWKWKLAGAIVLALLFLESLNLLSLPYNSDSHTISMHSISVPNPLVRGMEFCLGMATWVIWDRYIKNWRLSLRAWSLLEFAVLSVVAIWLCVFCGPLRNAIPDSIGLLLFDFDGSALPFAFLIAVLASGRGYISQLFSRRPFVFLGEISFSIYMLHQILMRAWVIRFPDEMNSSLIFFVMLFLISAASYLLVEKPAQRFLIGKKPGAIKPKAAQAPAV